MDRGAWWATVHGVTKSWTQLSDWAHDRGQLDSAEDCSYKQHPLCEENSAPFPLTPSPPSLSHLHLGKCYRGEERARSRWSINESTALHPHPAVHSWTKPWGLESKEEAETGGEVEFYVILDWTSSVWKCDSSHSCKWTEKHGIELSSMSREKGGDGDFV